MENYIHLIASISVLLFNVALLPDIFKVIKLKLCVGVSIWSNIIFITALVSGFVVNFYYGNYIFCINDVISIILQSIMLGLKLKYNK
jgi:uncharacterized protein with PQ loop repeat